MLNVRRVYKLVYSPVDAVQELLSEDKGCVCVNYCNVWVNCVTLHGIDKKGKCYIRINVVGFTLSLLKRTEIKLQLRWLNFIFCAQF